MTQTNIIQNIRQDISLTQNDDGSTSTYINPALLVDCLPELCFKPVDDAKAGELHIEEVAIKELVTTYQTPCYVYSKTAILNSYHAYTNALSAIDHQVCYAVKANSNLAVLSVLAKAGAGFDIVSIGELARVIKAGGDAKRVVYSGVGKTAADIEYALKAGIGCFNVEAISELSLINQVAKRMDMTANISLRVNPNVDPQTHPYISTGLKENKFGINHERALEVYQIAQRLPHLAIVGIDCHIGSQLTDIEPFMETLDKFIELIAQLQDVGIKLHHIDLGGGLGVQYIDEMVTPIGDFINVLLPKLQQLGLTVMLEPGRSLVANAGILLTSVDVLKPTEHKNFAVVDAAMNDLIRPALYQAEMAVIPTQLADISQPIDQVDIPNTSWDIVGAICETGDFLAKNRLLELEVGDVLAITGAGAYGFSMSSNYNTRPRAAEVMVAEGTHQLVRQRETLDSLYANESLWSQ